MHQCLFKHFHVYSSKKIDEMFFFQKDCIAFFWRKSNSKLLIPNSILSFKVLKTGIHFEIFTTKSNNSKTSQKRQKSQQSKIFMKWVQNFGDTMAYKSKVNWTKLISRNVRQEKYKCAYVYVFDAYIVVAVFIWSRHAHLHHCH